MDRPEGSPEVWSVIKSGPYAPYSSTRLLKRTGRLDGTRIARSLFGSASTLRGLIIGAGRPTQSTSSRRSNSSSACSPSGYTSIRCRVEMRPCSSLLARIEWGAFRRSGWKLSWISAAVSRALPKRVISGSTEPRFSTLRTALEPKRGGRCSKSTSRPTACQVTSNGWA